MTDSSEEINLYLKEKICKKSKHCFDDEKIASVEDVFHNVVICKMNKANYYSIP